MHRADRNRVRRRAQNIRKANKSKPTAENYLQLVIVLLLIAVILAGAFFFAFK
jgi:hypothetical protein